MKVGKRNNPKAFARVSVSWFRSDVRERGNVSVSGLRKIAGETNKIKRIRQPTFKPMNFVWFRIGADN